MMGILLSVGAALIASLVCAEAKAWMPSVLRLLLAASVSRLPEHLRERLKEEWSAYLSEVPGNVGKLAAAIGFYAAASKVRYTEQFSSLRMRGRLLLSRCKLISNAVLTEATRGSVRTRIRRALFAAKLAARISDLISSVALPVAAGVLSEQFGANIMRGAVSIMRAKASNEPPACWGVNTETGEVSRMRGGQSGQIIMGAPENNDQE